MKEENLFEAAKPILKISDYLFGINLEKEKMKAEGCLDKIKAEGWREMLARFNFRLVTGLYLCYYVDSAFFEHCDEEHTTCARMQETNSFGLSMIIFLINYSFYVIFDESRLKMLLLQLKAFPVTEHTRTFIRKHLIFILFLPTFFLSLLLMSLSRSINVSAENAYFYLGIILSLTICWVFVIGFLSALVFPAFLSSILCLVSSFCASHLNDVREEIKSAKSATRKAKLTDKLFLEFDKLNRLASMTNALLSDLMSLMRMALVLLLAQIFNALLNAKDEDDFQNLMFLLILYSQLFVYLIIYLKVAPSANDMTWLMFKTLIECQAEEDKWLPHDRILRRHLTENRLRMCVLISHQLLKEAPFTISGSPVDGLDILAMLVEINDMVNTLSAGEANIHNNVVFLVLFCLNFLNRNRISSLYFFVEALSKKTKSLYYQNRLNYPLWWAIL